MAANWLAKLDPAKLFSEVHAAAGDQTSLMTVRMPGEAWDLGASVAVLRSRTLIGGPMAFISGADDKDKANVKTWLVVLTVLAGGGIKGGQVSGKTSADGTKIEERKVTVPDLLATLCQAVGIDPKKQNISNVSRPIVITDPDANNIAEVL